MGRRSNRKERKERRKNLRKVNEHTKKRTHNTEQAKKFVNNFSKHRLTDTEYRALGKGIKFCPTPQMQNASKQIRSNFNELARKIRCRYHFADPQANTTLHPLRVNSGYQPSNACNPIEQYISNTKETLLHMDIRKTTNNMPKEERAALRALKNNPDIIIKKADNNSNIVILNREDYLEEGYTQLNNGIHYEPVNTANTTEIQDEIRGITEELRKLGQIDKETYKYLTLTDTDTRVGKCYLLPKIHKHTPERIKEMEEYGLGGTRLAGRPIISQCGNRIQRISKLVDLHLLPWVQKQDTYIKDTPAFIRTIEGIKTPPDTKIAVYNISSMYTNLRFDEVLEAVDQTLPTWVTTPPMPPTEKKHLLKLLSIILNNNIFTFDDKLYRQIVGVSMGSRVSPEAADIAMGKILKDIMNKFEHTDKILWQGRYRDDGIQLWQTDTETIHEFFRIANTHHPLLKFTYSIETETATFLDTQIFKGERFQNGGILDLRTYRKPTESYQYLQRDSAHPQHVFKALIRGETTRYVRTNNNKNDLDTQVNLLSTKLGERDYSEAELKQNTSEVLQKPRKEQLMERSGREKNQTPLVFVTKYNPSTKHLKRKLHQGWHHMTEDAECRELFPLPPIVAYKRQKNIGDTIMSAQLRKARLPHTQLPSTPLVPHVNEELGN